MPHLNGCSGSSDVDRRFGWLSHVSPHVLWKQTDRLLIVLWSFFFLFVASCTIFCASENIMAYRIKYAMFCGLLRSFQVTYLK